MHPNSKKYTLFSETHGTFSIVYHTSDHKASLNKYIKTEITPHIPYDNKEIELDISKRNDREYTTSCKQRSTLKMIPGGILPYPQIISASTNPQGCFLSQELATNRETHS